MKDLLAALCLVVVVPGLVFGQAPPARVAATQVTDAQRAEIDKVLTDATRDLMAHYAQQSTGAWVKYLSDHFEAFVSSGSILAQGKEANVKRIANVYSQRASQKIEADSIRVYVLSAESAYVVHAGVNLITTKGGRRGGYGYARTDIWRKEPGGWKVIHVHESTW